MLDKILEKIREKMLDKSHDKTPICIAYRRNQPVQPYDSARPHP